MYKLQDSVFSIVKTTNLSQSVFSYLLPNEDYTDIAPQGGILNDCKHGWLALGSRFCVVDLRTGLKIAARSFLPLSSTISSVIELSSPLTANSQQLIISLECEDSTGLIYVFHVNGSQVLRCIQTEAAISQLAVSDGIPAGPFACFDGMVMAGSKHGEIFVFDLNRAALMQALKDISQGYDQQIKGETNAANLTFLPLNLTDEIEQKRDLVLDNDDHIAILLNEDSTIDGQYIYRNPDGTVRMKAKRDHVRVTVLQYLPQLGSVAVGFNFGAFQIWNLMNIVLEFTSQVNVECLPVTHFGFQEPCDDPRAFCYLWVIFSVTDRLEEEGFPLAVMYSLTYLGKRMLSDTKCLYQEFSTATIRYQMELSPLAEATHFYGGRCVSCHTYSVDSALGEEGEESLLNLCQMVWECWGENPNAPPHYGILLFDLDQWYKDQMPATYQLQTNAFMSTTWCSQLSRTVANVLDLRMTIGTLSAYWHAARHDPHLYPNSLHYECICLTTSEISTLLTTGIQRQMISSIDEVGPTVLLNPTRLYHSCVTAGLTPLYVNPHERTSHLDEQRRYLLSVALEAKLCRFLKRCAHDWATGSHSGVGCTLTFLIDWCWKRALELKENAKELSSPLFVSTALPDRNVVRCLDHCVQQLTQLTGLLDAVLTKCCNLIVPDALSEIEEKFKGIGTVSLYFQVVQWFLRVGLLPERREGRMALPYPSKQLIDIYTNRRVKLKRLQEQSTLDGSNDNKSCSLLYIDQLIEHEFGGDRIHQLWIRGGSDCEGLYPPPSLYSLLRLYLLPDIAEEYKHSLVLYLLVDYSMVYEDAQYEAVIRRLMQFPTMFGLSNTAIKATQAFWHLDHRDFDFALDQLQCLTGNTLSDWQHNVVLSSLLAQKKTQAALQYLHVRKPAPIQSVTNELTSKASENDKLDDWQACCKLYLARGLVYEALDVVRMCVKNLSAVEDRVQVMNFFLKCCRNTSNLAKLMQVVLLPFEEETLINYLKDCNNEHTSDLLVLYYLQQARYIEAEEYNNKIRQSRPKQSDNFTTSAESILEDNNIDNTRDYLVEMMCSAVPDIARNVAKFVFEDKPYEKHVLAPKPMSVYIQAKSPKNTFTYKSSFIQDTIENASETWMNKPKMRKGIKRALNIEETPFICTPKLNRTRSIFSPTNTDSTPSKRAKLDLNASVRTPKVPCNINMSAQLKAILDMPEVQSPNNVDRRGAETPHSILKIRRNEALERFATSPVDSRYLCESDDEILETGSNHTNYSDKHLRFTIPTCSESGSTPSPNDTVQQKETDILLSMREREIDSEPKEKDADVSDESYFTTTSHPMTEPHPMESPPKKLAIEDNIKLKKSFKDTVRARRSLSISANSSLSEDPNISMESIADIPITLINPKYSRKSPETSEGQRQSYASSERENINLKYSRQSLERSEEQSQSYATSETENIILKYSSKSPERSEGQRQCDSGSEREKTPKGRRGIRSVGESTPLGNRSRSVTPERHDSPIVTPLRTTRITRGRSRTPELSPLAAILEHNQEAEVEPHAATSLFSATRQIRSRSRTPERLEKPIKESPKLEVISESPVKVVEEIPASPTRRNLRSRSRTPEVEMVEESKIEAPRSPRTLRNRAKTPDKIMSPKIEHTTKSKKSLTRIVLEANAFAKTKTAEKDTEEPEQQTEKVIECTPMKTLKQTPSLMDVTISPIVNKTILQSSVESVADTKSEEANASIKSLPAFTINETYFDKSVLQSYQSSVADASESFNESTQNKANDSVAELNVKSIPVFTSINVTDFDKSVLHSYESSVAETSVSIQGEKDKVTKITEEKVTKSYSMLKSLQTSDLRKSVLGSCNTSAAESSRDMSKANISSLMTSDSDMDVDTEWKSKADTEATKEQKEKQKIVELEREINEIEGDLSHDSEHNEESDSSDEEIVVAGEDDEESSDSSEEEQEGEETSDEEDGEHEEVICINDSDSDSIPNKLQIDEESSDNRATTENVREVNIDTESKDENMETANEVIDPLNHGQVSLLTDDNSCLSDRSDVNLNYSDEKKEVAENTEAVKNTVAADNTEAVTIEQDTKSEALQTDIETAADVNIEVDIVIENKQTSETSTETQTEQTNVENQNTQAPSQKTSEVELNEDKSEKTVSDNISEVQKDIPSQTKETTQVKALESKSPEKIDESEKPKTRKRINSTSSNKSAREIVDEVPEPRTPITRKRSQSIASNKSVSEEKQSEQTTPENVIEKSFDETTPSRRRGKTPTSSEVRRIITRRASKELSERSDDNKSLDESVSTTPTRRSARKKQDDASSVTSDTSVRSFRSKASEDTTDNQSKSSIRRGRKSTIVTKPDLCVIPENITETRDDSQVITELTASRRLTRNQKALLESWLEPTPSPTRRRPSTASKTSTISELSHEDEPEPFDVQPIDRISLLNKKDFEGSPDRDEIQDRISPESVTSDVSRQRRSRMTRAASEAKTTPKVAAKISRRISADIVNSEEPTTPSRGRRASFNKACEALHTPKGRRTSTDVKQKEGSQQGSPEPPETEVATPSRRGRRASTASNTSVTKDTSKRSKKTAVEETKEKKK